VVPKCESCGKRVGWRIEKRDFQRKNLCYCSSVVGSNGNYPHKKTHPFCDQHPMGIENQMRRSGYFDECPF